MSAEEAKAAEAGTTNITCSRGLAGWLMAVSPQSREFSTAVTRVEQFGSLTGD